MNKPIANSAWPPTLTGTSRSCSPSEVLHADHVTVWRWVQRYAPEMERRLRSRLRPTNDSWRVDETYIRVKGKWVYYNAAFRLGFVPLHPTAAQKRRAHVIRPALRADENKKEW